MPVGVAEVGHAVPLVHVGVLGLVVLAPRRALVIAGGLRWLRPLPGPAAGAGDVIGAAERPVPQSLVAVMGVAESPAW